MAIKKKLITFLIPILFTCILNIASLRSYTKFKIEQEELFAIMEEALCEGDFFEDEISIPLEEIEDPSLKELEEKEIINITLVDVKEEAPKSLEENEDPSLKEEETETEVKEEAPKPEFDRQAPLYKVYRDGDRVTVSTDLQWYIRDMCNEYGFCEKYVYGMIVLESAFQPRVSNGDYKGLCQISPFWITKAKIKHFTKDYYNRNLYDPYDNLLTLCEMWCYAKDTYGLDLQTDEGNMRLLYWHNTGCDPRYITSSSYFNKVVKYSEELVKLQ